MTPASLPTEPGCNLAPPGRAAALEVEEYASLCLVDPVLHAVLLAVDSYAVILNAQRQILAANPVLLEALALEEPAACGLRMGEAFGCVHATEGQDGCGSSQACRRCGALLSVLSTQGLGQPASGECLMSIQRNGRWEAREFFARSLPIEVSGHRLTLLTLQDISAQKRREMLERIFIHDLMNSLQGLRGWTEILQGAGANPANAAQRILDMAGHLTAEVEAQRRLLQAEYGDLSPDTRSVSPARILADLSEALGPEVDARMLRLPSAAEDAPIRTDPAILARILTNMVRNAMEAMPTGAQGRIWYESRDGRPRFTVQNPGCIPPEVADRIFQRSFSTKASRGRGLGTYGMKVLGESVLGGKVGFTTNWEEGTQFFIELPAAD